RGTCTGVELRDAACRPTPTAAWGVSAIQRGRLSPRRRPGRRRANSVVTTSAAHSLWLDHDAPAPRVRLHEDLKVDVAVIGGGIAGITTALLCARDGARVAVMEARRVA